jgi:hypothetical protein
VANASVTITGTPEAPIFNFDIPQGEQGPPGGIVLGADLSTIHLNTILTAGTYRQTQGANVSTTLGYPVTTNATCVMQVWGVSATNVVQRMEFTIGTYARRVFWERVSSDGGTTWSTWAVYASARVDQTAGRAIYQWDDANNREQLIYGDTGVRDVKLDIKNGWTVSLMSLRRVGSMVTFGFYSMNPAAKTDPVAYSMPSGFRPASYGGNLGFQVKTAFSPFTDNVSISGAGDVTPPAGGISGSGIISLVTFSTSDAWPTTLPGTASGTIPNI